MTVPKFRLAGFDPRTAGDAVPSPVSDRFIDAFDASLVMLAVALKVFALSGVNLMLIVVLWPDARDAGRLGPVSEKYLVENAAPLMLRDAVPEFVAVTVRVLLLPAVILPKSRFIALNESVPDGWPGEPEPPALTPWQPARNVSPARRSRAAVIFSTDREQVFEATVFGIWASEP